MRMPMSKTIEHIDSHCCLLVSLAIARVFWTCVRSTVPACGSGEMNIQDSIEVLPHWDTDGKPL